MRDEEHGHDAPELTRTRLDTLAKGLAEGRISRGRALKLAGAVVLGGTGLLGRFAGSVDAQVGFPTGGGVVPAGTDNSCKGRPAINNDFCPETNCNGKNGCFCAKTLNGTKKCVNLRDEPCPRRNQCNENKDCAKGSVCIKTAGCCGKKRNACVKKCRG